MSKYRYFSEYPDIVNLNSPLKLLRWINMLWWRLGRGVWIQYYSWQYTTTFPKALLLLPSRMINLILLHYVQSTFIHT